MNYDLELTKEKLFELMKTNKLKRNTKINNLLKIINLLKKNTILSIDGNWGCGKTVFVKQIELINKENLEDLGNNIGLEKNVIDEFNSKYIVYYYNAWENDNHEDPLKSIIFKIVNDFPKEQNQIFDETVQLPLDFKKFIKSISCDLINIDKVKSYKDLVESIYTVEEQKKALNNLLNNIIPNDKKIVMIIDELDRCNPNFAVKLIETIKHFFNNNNLIFILASNNEQLACTISKFYGEKFDGYGYLNKIYDLIFTLENIDPNTYIDDILSVYLGDTWSVSVIKSLCEYYNFSMREINRYIYIMDLLSDYYNSFDSFSENSLLKYVFVPYCLALKIRSVKIFNEFISGRNIDDFISIIKKEKDLTDVIDDIISKDKSNLSQRKTPIEYVEDVYNIYFNNYSSKNRLTHKTKSMFLDVISMISNFSSIC